MPRDDISSLLARLDAIPKTVRSRVQPSIEKGADELVTRMRGLAPVKTGKLRSSIQWHDTGVPLSARITAGGEKTTKEVRAGSGADYDYALGVEYGTADTQREPFFWVTVRTAGRKVKRRIDRAIGKAIKEEWRK
ncbi:HK97-gp10 family putative phage morphogenesis protein [Mesorhizobium sp. SP-1A]|uniref:HK97-gp10 family putative phage morphogenesis protein n=1 Tax=Mesorhizobium sp. SP-1A TaxID=3077840 RepID=UPI0028F6F22C|nr:HK97-gp10 family putative phage morphogenesis protein [Mesorhizobium sp. SP-1A]